MALDRRRFLAGAMSAGAISLATHDAAAQESEHRPVSATADWMIDPKSYRAQVIRSRNGSEIEITNGLVSRIFRLSPNAATVAIHNLMTGKSELRSVRPEAVVTINDYELQVGGLYGLPVQNYFLIEWLEKMTASPRDFQFIKVEEEKTVARFPWKRVPQWSTRELAWPPPGVAIVFHYDPGPMTPIKDVHIRIRYELYDGIPLMAKWIEIENHGHAPIGLNSFKAEMLAVAETSTSQLKAETPSDVIDRLASLHVVTDYAFGGSAAAEANPAVHWERDPAYGDHSQPTLLECKPPVGPEVEIAPGQPWQSFGVFELLHDSSDMERRGLAMRKMMTTLAPWARENPIFMHARNAAVDKVREVIDQCAEVGFEMVILSFGSGFDIENDSPQSLQAMKELADYARLKGIAIGGYSLLASRGGAAQDLVVDVKTGRPGGGKFGPSPCLCSHWAEGYFGKLRAFFETTGMNVFENDGSYPGDYCASAMHSGHRGYLDSQWKQWEVMSDFYRWCRGEGIYLTVPDWYFLNGQSKTAMGYSEGDWSLPREYQPLIERQDIYDGTWEKTPSMGWMHVPLMEYHGGGSSATVEPLNKNLAHYEMRLGDLLGAGVQAAWRGERLYDTDETRKAVKKWVDFYKKNRAILESDIIHLRRPDGQDWDGILHVNPELETRGLAMIYNPLDQAISREVKLPLYYTGLTHRASVQIQAEKMANYSLDRNFCISVFVRIPAQSCTWISVH